jgi:methylmalonyl-CoA/ethylmalonyl-CoA epimerase
MPSGPLAHVCLVVRDLDAALEDWSKILGVLDPRQLDQQVVRYEGFEGGEDRMRWATFVSPHGAEMQFIEPAPDTPMGKRLEQHGEHVHHICFTTPDPAGAAERLRAEGIGTSEELNTDPQMPWQAWTWVHRDSAHGTLVEIARPYEAVDGRWRAGSPQKTEEEVA